ncbi:MAG: chemotaxis protein CheW [Candidatus Competibacter sp.]|nr:chemotaxis protein CheW [Candidatus Competibacter sp.]MDG4583455.1 chemotaxis protein CheW [Candidatus Competibacter sp.]
MNDKAGRTVRRWLEPTTALNRFKPPPGIMRGLAATERQRARYGFWIGDFGLLINQNTTSEVLERWVVYPLPNVSSWFLGLINLRGNLVPVFDVKRFLQLEEGSREKRWLLILDQGAGAVGLFIDGLPQPASTRHALPRLPPLPAVLRLHIAGGYMQDDRTWLEFDHRSFFQSLGEQAAGMS